MGLGKEVNVNVWVRVKRLMFKVYWASHSSEIFLGIV